ncbi:penicillin-insensitive murein endopeptidase [Conexibacter sp. SYSU D00693]|uniref:penicillin-insensitive murein endopeptidase n=1 Tax=Conexibacter sp. SYSU D00693 TaxID=2812560 RepID=UPI00196A4DB9|nr:penicillin-insensitive murein endopeptidase [Conexibacter sp. SYSU D00693]
MRVSAACLALAVLPLAGCAQEAAPAAVGPERAAAAVPPSSADRPLPALLAAMSSATAQATPLPAQVVRPRALTPRTKAPAPAPAPPAVPGAPAGWQWRSVSLGKPNRGRLRLGVELPASGPHHLTWDAPLQRSPSRPWRRWGTDRLVWTVQAVAASYRAAHPEAPPLLVGDLSRPTGGVFDRRYGGLGHASHQNGRDVDVFYPRKDRLPIAPQRPADVDRRLAQDLVDRFVAAGAQFVFVGPRLDLKGPEGVVQELVHHDDHLHVRLR